MNTCWNRTISTNVSPTSKAKLISIINYVLSLYFLMLCSHLEDMVPVYWHPAHCHCLSCTVLPRTSVHNTSNTWPSTWLSVRALASGPIMNQDELEWIITKSILFSWFIYIVFFNSILRSVLSEAFLSIKTINKRIPRRREGCDRPNSGVSGWGSSEL